MTDGLDFIIGQFADLTARFNKKSWLIGTGAQIAASTSGLEKGKHAHCTSTGTGFTIDHDYIYNGTAWVDNSAGRMVLLNIDETGASLACTGSPVTPVTYALAANTYARIMVIAQGAWSDVYDSSDDPSSFDATINIGASTKIRTMGPPQFTSGQVSDNTGEWEWDHRFSAVQTGAATVSISGDHNGTASRSFSVARWEVWGIL